MGFITNSNTELVIKFLNTPHTKTDGTVLMVSPQGEIGITVNFKMSPIVNLYLPDVEEYI